MSEQYTRSELLWGRITVISTALTLIAFLIEMLLGGLALAGYIPEQVAVKFIYVIIFGSLVTFVCFVVLLIVAFLKERELGGF